MVLYFLKINLNDVGVGWQKKIQVRGIIPTIRRIIENLLIRKNQISKLIQKNIKKVYYVDSINSEEVREILLSNSVDLLLLTATPIIKSTLINIHGLSILNAHTGWLPKYRGLDANLKAMRDGYQPGVSVHKVTEKIDAGEIYLREKFQINFNDDILEQMDQEELKISGKLFVEAVNLKRRDMLTPIAVTEPLGKYEPALTVKEKKRIIQKLQKGAA
ncbi:MAG: formyltransferase family protein [Promethearchaeota archaeon]|jgi:methionyl-tRNA formyltransferase